MLLRRRNEAQRSIVVQVGSVDHMEAVWQQCSAVGHVINLMHYTVSAKKNTNTKVDGKSLLLREMYIFKICFIYNM